METLRRLVRQSVHSVPINLCHFPNACKQEKGYSTITDGIPDKCGKPRLSCKETLFSPYVSLYYRTKIK